MNKKHSIKLLLFCLFISIFLHFFIMLRYSTGSNLQHEQDKQSKNKYNDTSNDDLDDNKTHIWVGAGIIPCDSYEGIGVQFNNITGIVSHVAPDSPAYKAGIKVNDEIVTPLWNMDLRFGQKIDLVVVRNGKNLTLPIIVDRICHE